MGAKPEPDPCRSSALMGVAAIQREGEMSAYLWWVTAEDVSEEMLKSVPTFVTAHAVREDGDQTRTVCGHPVPVLGPDNAWRMRDQLGDWRICDNCGSSIARHDDAGDQPLA